MFFHNGVMSTRVWLLCYDSCFRYQDCGQKTYDEFAEWCEDRSKDLQFEIKTGKGNKADLEATIQKETANIAEDEADMKKAIGIATRNTLSLWPRRRN